MELPFKKPFPAFIYLVQEMNVNFLEIHTAKIMCEALLNRLIKETFFGVAEIIGIVFKTCLIPSVYFRSCQYS